MFGGSLASCFDREVVRSRALLTQAEQDREEGQPENDPEDSFELVGVASGLGGACSEGGSFGVRLHGSGGTIPVGLGGNAGQSGGCLPVD